MVHRGNCSCVLLRKGRPTDGSSPPLLEGKDDAVDAASARTDKGDAIRLHQIIRELTIIQGQAQLMLRRLNPDSPAGRDAADRLRSIVEASQRITELYR